MEETKYYILFPNYTEGMKLESMFKKKKIKYTIVPTPRELSASCGISIMYDKEDENIIESVIEENNVTISGLHSVTKKAKNYYLD